MKVYQGGQIKYVKTLRINEPIQQVYFTAPQIGKIISETATTVRFWASQFEVYRKAGSHTWHYPRASVAQFHQIKYLLRTEKFTIEGAKLKLKSIHV
jgi:hypothetical protein